MKNIKYKLLTVTAFALIGAAVLSACKRENAIEDQEMQIMVDAAVNTAFDGAQNAATRLNASGFVEGDQISFFAVKYTNGTPNVLGSDESTFLNNVLYQRVGGLFKHYDGAAYVRDYFPSDGSPIDVYGLYPYNSYINDFGGYAFKVVTDQKSDPAAYFQSDLMMAKTGNIAPQAVPTRMLFQHLLTKVEVNVKLKNFDPAMTIKEVKILNIVPDAKVVLNAFDGTSTTVTLGSEPTSTILPADVSPATVGFLKTYTAIVPPQLIVGGSPVIEVVLNNPEQDAYTLKLADNFTLQSGMKNVFDVTVNFGVRPSITASCSIIPWTQEYAGEGTVEKEPDYKFKVVLLNEQNSPARAQNVKIGVNGNRTFQYGGKYVSDVEDGNSAIFFAISGEGNRPGEGTGLVKFTLNRLELLDASGSSFDQCVINPIVDVKTMGEMTLYYDMTAHTIKTTK